MVTKDDLSNLEVMSFSTYGRACEAPEHLIDEFVKISLNLFAEKESPPPIFDGLSEVIKHLSSKHKIAIVTTNSSQNVRAFLTKHAMANTLRQKILRGTLGRNRHDRRGREAGAHCTGDKVDYNAGRNLKGNKVQTVELQKASFGSDK